MPELPDITLYTLALRHRTVGSNLSRIAIRSPFLLRTFDPPIESALGRRVGAISNIGKRIVIELEGDLFLVLHLMISGRLLWKAPNTKPAGKIDLAAFAFDGGATGPGTLILTEASPKKRASLHLISGHQNLAAMHPGGINVLECTPEQFAAALLSQRRTLKRALSDPRTFDGTGNAYSDEILWQARLSPITLTTALSQGQVAQLHTAAIHTLTLWTIRLLREFGIITDEPTSLSAIGKTHPGRFPGPGDITAFRPDFAVHGKFGKPCPACGTKVQRVVRAENEFNYCPRCQTGGKVLADRSLSRLLKDDWPRTVEEWEGM